MDRTTRNLQKVHPDLVKVFRLAEEMHPGADPVVTEGARTVERQKEMVAKGASKTMNSRHIIASNGYAHALDVAFIIGGKVNWSWPLYQAFAVTMKKAAKKLGIPIEWGGDWRTFKDGPHFQLPFKSYPK